MNIMPELPIPEHFDAGTVGEVWRVPYLEHVAAAKAYADKHELPPVVEDETRVCLLLVDCQNTFCTPGFELFVAGRSGNGAVEDSIRLCRFMYRNLHNINHIVCTMDSHRAAQIFHGLFWIDDEGHHPEPLTVITVSDVRAGRWKVNPVLVAGGKQGSYDRIQDYALHYVQQLAAKEKYDLTIWPYHAMIGGVGHALVAAVEEAVFFHNVARMSRPEYQIKGDNMLTEHYSVLSPEVREDQKGEPIGEKNTSLLNELIDFDAVLVAGQAKSHCVAWTVDDLLGDIKAKDPGLARKVYLLEDCMAPVVVPGVVDFTDRADEIFGEFQQAGLRIVSSEQPMADWLVRVTD